MKTSGNIMSPASTWLLELAFGDKADEVWVCWTSNMQGKRVKDLAAGDLPETEDCYFCVGLLKPGAVGRSNANVESVHVLVVDDVGTKIDAEAFRMLAPKMSYWVESSRGNFQAGYIIDGSMEPSDYAALRRAMKGSKIWGHADGIDPAHLFRLPQGTNTKPTAAGFKPKGASHVAV